MILKETERLLSVEECTRTHAHKLVLKRLEQKGEKLSIYPCKNVFTFCKIQKELGTVKMTQQTQKGIKIELLSNCLVECTLSEAEGNEKNEDNRFWNNLSRPYVKHTLIRPQFSILTKRIAYDG
jgi:hypothetical protein